MNRRNKRKLLNDLAFANASMRARYQKKAPDASKRITVQKVRELPKEQKEHVTYLLALEVGAPYRRDLKYIARKLNLTVQAARYLINSSLWSTVVDRVLQDVRAKYLVQIHGKAVELALQGSKYHFEAIMNLSDKLVRKQEIQHKYAEDLPETDEELNAELNRLQTEVGDLDDIPGEESRDQP